MKTHNIDIMTHYQNTKLINKKKKGNLEKYVTHMHVSTTKSNVLENGFNPVYNTIGRRTHSEAH